MCETFAPRNLVGNQEGKAGKICHQGGEAVKGTGLA